MALLDGLLCFHSIVICTLASVIIIIVTGNRCCLVKFCGWMVYDDYDDDGSCFLSRFLIVLLIQYLS